MQRSNIPHRIVGIAACLVAATSAACSAPGSTAPATGNGNQSTGGVDASGPVSLPFVVSDDFVPSGFMGDSPTDFNSIKLSSSSAECPTRLPGALGTCYKVAWTPLRVGDAGSSWVGVYWQYPQDNWGAKAGRQVAPGATKVTFSAYSEADGLQVEFIAGGVNVTGGMPNLTYADSFTAMTTVTLTTSWAQYEIPLSGDSYSSVIGGFAWSITTSSTAPVTFYIDNIEWEATPDTDAGE
jgi:hypothetical protein